MTVSRNCCNCAATPGTVCFNTVPSLTDLLYVAGLDADLCPAYQAIADTLGLIDCLGNPITSTTPIVVCSNFQAELCDILAGLPLAGLATVGVTQLIGNNCQTFTIPETPLANINSPSVAISLTGPFNHTIRADVIISPDLNNALEIRANGLYATVPNFCQSLQNLLVGDPAIPGTTLVVGSDCLLHTFTETPLVATDSLSIDFTTSGLFGHDLTGVVIISPNAGNELTNPGNGLFVPHTVVVGQATFCLDTVVAEAPFNTFTITVFPIISPTAGNQISCTPTGLFVPPVQVPFNFVSPLALSHNIVHNRGNTYPLVVVWDTVTGQVVIPDTIQSNSPNDLTITFFAARAIAGTVL